MRRHQHDAAFRNARNVRQRTLLDEKAVNTVVDVLCRRAENVRQMPLRIEIDAGGTVATLRDCGE